MPSALAGHSWLWAVDDPRSIMPDRAERVTSAEKAQTVTTHTLDQHVE
jgi:hypothetical protein